MRARWHRCCLAAVLPAACASSNPYAERYDRAFGVGPTAGIANFEVIRKGEMRKVPVALAPARF